MCVYVCCVYTGVCGARCSVDDETAGRKTSRRAISDFESFSRLNEPLSDLAFSKNASFPIL